jgi:hypothetical protein
MEHASIAAFARFALELLSLGAPSDLVRATNDALADEIEHTRIAFGLASAYAGRPVGPGLLSVHRALSESSFVAIVRTAFLEACIGEACAAIEAGEAALWAADPAVKTAWERIAADEMRHATLGFRFVKWALGRAGAAEGEALRAALLAELARVANEQVTASEERTSASLLAHGVLPHAMRSAARQAALREVVLPCARGLLAVAHEGEPARA